LGGAVAFGLLLALPARAEQWTKKSFTMPQGSFELTGDPANPAMAGVRFFRRRSAALNLAPHLYGAVTDYFSIGISHDTGLCFTGCEKKYDDVGLDLILKWFGGDGFELAFHGGVPLHRLDPLFMGVQLGVLGRINAGSVLAVVFDPALYVGVTHREAGLGSDIPGPGNREELYVPLWLYFQATEVVVPFVGAGAIFPLDRDPGRRLTAEAGVLFDVTEDVDLGASVGLWDVAEGLGYPNGHLLGRFRY
jgi:hypothetical protein